MAPSPIAAMIERCYPEPVLGEDTLSARQNPQRNSPSDPIFWDIVAEMESGDLEEGLRAASAIGDDRIQRMQTGHVFPDKFTHGSSDQRVTWLRRGFESGNPEACNTFR